LELRRFYGLDGARKCGLPEQTRRKSHLLLGHNFGMSKHRFDLTMAESSVRDVLFLL